MRRNDRWVALVTLVALVVGLIPGAAWARSPVFSQPPGGSAGSSAEEFAPDAYETDDTPEQATELVLDGVPQERTLHSATDSDWVQFTLEAGERAVIYTTGSCDTFMFLFGTDTTRPLRRDDDSGEDLNAAIPLSAQQDGTYYVRVIPYDNLEACESYGLVGELLPPIATDAFEPDNTPAEAGELALDASVQDRSIHTAADADWVALRLQAGNRLNIFTTGRCDTLLHFYDRDGTTLLAEDDDGGVGLNADIEYVVGEGGAYFARVRLITDDEVCESYGLSATLLPPVPADVYEPDDQFEQARPLSLDGSPQAHTFHANGESDWVSFTLSTGDRLFLMTTGPCDTLLFLYGSDGNTLLRRDDDSGEEENAAMLFTALNSGTYYARVTPISRARAICDGYRLYGARFPASLATATPTAGGTPAPGTPGGTPAPTGTPGGPAAPTSTPGGPAPTSTPAPPTSTPAAPPALTGTPSATPPGTPPGTAVPSTPTGATEPAAPTAPSHTPTPQRPPGF